MEMEKEVIYLEKAETDLAFYSFIYTISGIVFIYLYVVFLCCFFFFFFVCFFFFFLLFFFLFCFLLLFLFCFVFCCFTFIESFKTCSDAIHICSLPHIAFEMYL